MGEAGAGNGRGGNAVADAAGAGEASLNQVRASATAGQSVGNLVQNLSSSADTPFSSGVSVGNRSHAEALRHGPGFDTGSAAGQQASAFNYAAPDATVSLPLVEGNAVHANFDIAGINGPRTTVNSGQLDSDVFGVGVLGGSYAVNGDGTTRTTSSNTTLSVDTNQFQAADQNLLVGFMNPVIDDADFGDPDFNVRFRISREGSVVVDQTFTTAAAAHAFFDGQTLDLGAVNAGLNGTLDLGFRLDVTGDNAGAGIAVDYIVGNSSISQRAVPFVPTVNFNLGDSHVGDSAQTGITITNVAVAGSDGANAVFTATSGNAVTNGGTLTGLAPGASDVTSLRVGIDTSASGNRGGIATVELRTDGSVSGTAEVFGSTDVTVSGSVYALADPIIDTSTPIDFGNLHVGDVASQVLSIRNNAADDGFSENLDASAGSVSGAAGVAGSFTGLGPQAGNATDIVVSLDTSVAGSRVGTATVDFVSDGAGVNTLGQTALAGQSVTVSGDVYRLAEATVNNPLAFNFGNVHVGDTLSQAVSLTNSAAADGFSESLNASFGGVSDTRITAGGAVNLLAAGATDTTHLVVGVDTSTAGSVNGSATLNFTSDGSGTSGLGTTGLPSQDLNVSAAISASVFRLANPVINNPQPIAFGNVRVGAVLADQAISITNDVPNDGNSEALNASAGGTSGGVVNNGGSFSLLAPGATNATDISVNIDTSSAGDKGGVSTIDFVSDGAGSSGLGQTVLASQNVAVTGKVFRLAEVSVTPVPIVLNARVGDSAQQAITIVNTASADGFSEGLGVSAATASGDARLSGVVAGPIAAGASNSTLTASVDTATSGTRSGSVDLSFTSDGAGTSGLAAIANGNASITVTGNIYATAVADVRAPVGGVDFGIVHVGDSVAARNIAVGNTASGALTDVLQGGFNAVTGSAFSAGGDLGAGVAAGDTDATSLQVALDTSTAGIFSGTASLGLRSHDNDLTDLALAAVDVALQAQVNAYANPVFDLINGAAALSGGGSDFVLDFGNLLQGASSGATLAVLNDVVGSAVDLLDGTFIQAGGNFALADFDPFFGLGGGDASDNLLVSLDTTGLGLGMVQGFVTLLAEGHNASGFREAFAPIRLTLRANVTSGNAPLPGTLVLLLLGLAIHQLGRLRAAGRI